MPAQKRVNEWALNQACRKQRVPINPAWRLATGQLRLPGCPLAQAGAPPARSTEGNWVLTPLVAVEAVAAVAASPPPHPERWGERAVRSDGTRPRGLLHFSALKK